MGGLRLNSTPASLHALQFRQNPQDAPAMAAGLADQVWSLDEIVLLAN